MLSELSIRDFAIIDELHMQLSFGFNVLTGETGAGKSIILDGLALLLGDRADTTLVRAGTERAMVEGTFELTPALQTVLTPLLAAEGIEPEEGQEDVLLLTREIRANGRSLCRVNGSVVNLSTLRMLGDYLVDIHGQGEHLSLLRPRSHLPVLDAYGGLETEREALTAGVRRLRRLQQELSMLRKNAAERTQREDFLSFQVQEIDAANLSPDEESELREERSRLANMEQLMQHASAAVMLADGEEAGAPGLRDLLGQLELDGTAVARLDAGMSDWLSRLQELVYQFEDLAREIRRYQEALEFDPDRLAQLEERLELLNRLKRKYGRDISGIIAYRQEAADELEGITHSDERIKALAAQEQEMLARLGEQAHALSQRRQAVAARLAQDVVGELADLRMEDARFAFDFDWIEEATGLPVGDRRLAFDESGIDRGEFLISANPGEPLKPLAKVASGGETARLMLALKSALARVDQTPTLIFDEIDQGIGGRVGDIVGRKLWELARHGGHQVIVVTHLPQLAGYGDTHFQVDKEVSAGRTRTLVMALDEQARVNELAAMLGTQGANAGEGAAAILQHAGRVKGAALSDSAN